MTTVSQIIYDAFRQSNLLALGAPLSEPQVEEALRHLERVLLSSLGNEIGEPLIAFPIGNKDISRPSGYPWWSTVPDNDWFVPKNTRLMFNLQEGGVNVFLHPDPDDGTRFGAIDVAKTFSQFPVTIHGNGRSFEGLTEVTLSEDGFKGEWIYRSDLANWMKVLPLDLEQEFPFPQEFDEYFITMLALRLNPAYGASIDDQTSEVFRRSRTQIKARYSQTIPTRSELALIRPAKVAADRDEWGNTYWLYQPNSMFDKGWPW